MSQRKSQGWFGAVVLALCVALGGCAPTETGNPDAAIALVGGVSDDGDVVSDSSQQGLTTIESAWIAFDAVRFVRVGACSEPNTEPPVFERVVIDVANDGLVEPAPQKLGALCEFRIRRGVGGATLPTGAPAELASAHVVMTGWRPEGTPFRIVSTASSDIVGVGFMGSLFALDDDTSYILFNDLSTWFDGIDLFANPPGADGIVRIDATNDPAQLMVFDANLTNSVRMFEDANANRRAERSEFFGNTTAKPGF